MMDLFLTEFIKAIKGTMILLLLVTGSILCYSQPKNAKGNITIDPKVKSEVQRELTPLSEIKTDTLGYIYFSHLLWDLYSGDSLLFSNKDSSVTAPLKAFYGFRNDSLFVLGEFGLTSGFRFGFMSSGANKDRNITTKHFFCDEMPSFKKRKEDSLQYCIEVACPKSSLTLAEMPTLTARTPLYGYVDFRTEEFYSGEGDEIRKSSSYMRVHFYARRIDLE